MPKAMYASAHSERLYFIVYTMYIWGMYMMYDVWYNRGTEIGKPLGLP